MSASSSGNRSGEYALLWFFAAAAFIGVAGITSLAWGSARLADATPVAPSTEEYRTAASSALSLFLGQAKPMTSVDFDVIDAATLRVVVDDAQARLLEMRVPGSEREAHLAFVLMLERWKRAFDGASDERQQAILQLRAALASYPWVETAAAQPL